MRTSRLFLAAAIAVGGMTCFTSSRARAQNAAQRAGDKIENAADKTGDAIKHAGQKLTGATTNPAQAMAPDVDDIRKTLANSAEASLTKGGFDDLIERFSDSDRNRLGKEMKGNQEFKNDTTLDGRIAQFQKDWKDKYNQDFNIKDRNAVFDESFAMIRQGELPGYGSARMAGERESGAAANTPGTTGDMNTPAPTANPDGTARSAPSGTANQPTGDASVNNNNDRMNKAANRADKNMASVTVQASHGLPELSVPMIHEFPDSWKIDIPDNLTAQQLRDNLLKHLTMADEQKDQWPSDPNEAYRLVSHHVLMAVMNVDEQGRMMDTKTSDMNNNDRTPGAAKRSSNQ
jgi:hypothetical protein